MNTELSPDRNQNDQLARPIHFKEAIFTSKNSSGIPVIREVLIIEIEPSPARVVNALFKLIIIGLIIHLFLTLWKKIHPRSHKILCQLLLFFAPPLFALFIGDAVFLFVYFLYMCVTSGLLIKINRLRRELNITTAMFKILKGVGRACYVGTVITISFIVVGYFISNSFILGTSFPFFMLCLYFGLITREISEVLTSKLAKKMGYYTEEGVLQKIVNPDTCALCDVNLHAPASENPGITKNAIQVFFEKFINSKSTEPLVITLNCKHAFHTKCLKDWVYTGKKAFCPCCMEGVSLTLTNLFEKTENFYNELLDGMRKMVVFTSIFIIKGFLYR